MNILMTAVLSAAVLITSTNVWAAAVKKPFTAEEFSAAQEANAPILIDIGASWCPTCKKQKQVINDIVSADQFADLIILEVDYDTQKEVVREFKAPRQSTLIAYRGATETDRKVAVVSEEEIKDLIESAYTTTAKY